MLRTHALVLSAVFASSVLAGDRVAVRHLSQRSRGVLARHVVGRGHNALLLELPEPIQNQVEVGILPPATAYEISKIEDESEQAELAAQVVRNKLSRQETARVVRELASRSKHAGFADTIQLIARRLGIKVAP